MVTRGFFDHFNPEGEGPADRMRRAGADFELFGEVIGDFRASPGFFQDILAAGGADCEEVLDPRFQTVGVGHYQGVAVIVLASLPDGTQ
jgi:uncharacterized protein YkwD